VEIGDRWNWLRIVSNGGLWSNKGLELSGGELNLQKCGRPIHSG
jgi:hypothetical protein